MEALLLNSSAVYLKWKQPAMQAHNGEWILVLYFHCDPMHLIKMLRFYCKSIESEKLISVQTNNGTLVDVQSASDGLLSIF